MPCVEDVTIFGNALHLLVDAAVDDAEIERELTAAAGSPVHVRPIDALARGRLRAADPLQADATATAERRESSHERLPRRPPQGGAADAPRPGDAALLAR